MSVLYLIFSHDHQEQLARLVSAIHRLSPGAEIAVHHDPQLSPLDPALLSEPHAHRIPDPIRGEWGDYSLVHQYLHALQWCLRNLEFDWVVTLTGLSYPSQPLAKFEAMLCASGQDGFVYHFAADDPAHWPAGTATTRFRFSYFKLPKFHYWHRIPTALRTGLQQARIWLNARQPFIRIAPRPRGLNTMLGLRRLRVPFANKLRLQGGRQMLTINAKALRAVLQFVDDSPRYVAWMRSSFIPDESFFTTILMNTPGLRITNDVQRFIKWPRNSAHAASGAVITAEEIPEVLGSGAPFALKLDSRVDARALDLLDEHLRLHLNPI